jgi:HK97 family phage major capsid protein
MNTNEIAGLMNEFGQSIVKFKAKYDGRLDGIERAIAMQGGPGGGGNYTSSGVYKNFGDQLLDIVAVSRPGGAPESRDRLFKVMAAASGLNENTPSEGGFLIQPDFSTDLISNAVQKSILQPLCFNMKVGANSNGVKIPLLDETSRATGSRFGGITAFWKAESAPLEGSKPKFREVNLLLHKLTGLCYASDELMQDSAVLGRVISSGFASELAFRKDDAILNGLGAYMPLGVLNAGCLVEVAAETGQKSDSILAENVIKMWSRLAVGSEANAVWLANKNVLPQLLTMSLSVGTGGIGLYQPANQLAGAPYQTLFGRPVIFVEQCPTLGEKGDIILADLSQYLWIEKTIQQDVSIHVMFTTGEQTFRFVLRCDGMPMRAVPLAPFKGSAETSPFVCLAAR